MRSQSVVSRREPLSIRADYGPQNSSLDRFPRRRSGRLVIRGHGLLSITVRRHAEGAILLEPFHDAGRGCLRVLIESPKEPRGLLFAATKIEEKDVTREGGGHDEPCRVGGESEC